MTLKEMLDLLNQDLKHEYQHMLVYMHAANVLKGLERVYLVPVLKAHAAEEMQHVFEFAHKIRGKGGVPVNGLDALDFPYDFYEDAQGVINYAIKIEEEVVKNYHKRHAQATKLHTETGEHYDLVIFLEEQIEHSQHDVDEFRQIAANF